MTRTSENRRDDYIGTGATATYSYNFKIDAESEIRVVEEVIATGVRTVLTLTTDYTVTGVGNKLGGTIVLTAGNLPATKNLSLLLYPDLKQQKNFRDQAAPFPDQIEKLGDKVTAQNLRQEDSLERSIKIPETVDPSTIDTTLPDPAANVAFRWDATGTALENFTLAPAGSIVLPGSNGMAVYTGSSTFISRTITAGDGITVTNGDGQSGNPTITLSTLEQLLPQEQSTPDNTVLVSAGYVFDHNDPTASPTTIAANAASGVTFPVVTANSRIDLLVVNYSGTFSRVAGTQAASPSAPAYPNDKMVIAEVTVDETSTVVVNTADIRDVRPILQQRQGLIADTIVTTRDPAVTGEVTYSHNLGTKPQLILASVVGFNGSTRVDGAVFISYYDGSTNKGMGFGTDNITVNIPTAIEGDDVLSLVRAAAWKADIDTVKTDSDDFVIDYTSGSASATADLEVDFILLAWR